MIMSVAIFSTIEGSAGAVLVFLAGDRYLGTLFFLDRGASGVGRLRSWKFCACFKDAARGVSSLSEAHMPLAPFRPLNRGWEMVLCGHQHTQFYLGPDGVSVVSLSRRSQHGFQDDAVMETQWK